MNLDELKNKIDVMEIVLNMDKEYCTIELSYYDAERKGEYFEEFTSSTYKECFNEVLKWVSSRN